MLGVSTQKLVPVNILAMAAAVETWITLKQRRNARRPVRTASDSIELFLLVLSNKFLINDYKHTGTLFLGSSYHYLFKIWHMFRVPANLTKTVCVYLYLCMYLYCVFACQRLGNIVFEVLVPFPFQKYSTCWVYLQIWPNCICVFAYLCICICVFGPQTLSLDQFGQKNASPFSLTFSFGRSKSPKKC